MSAFALAAFWGSAAFVAWTWVVFPLVLGLRALRPRPLRTRDTEAFPEVDLLIVVHNEEAVIGAKLANLEALDYPRDRLHAIVVSDGSDDATERLVGAHAGATPVALLALERVGKNAALNAGLEACVGEVVVLSDADSLLAPDALRRLVAPFADPEVGAVAGDFRYVATEGEGRGERSYWTLDRGWRWLESRAGSVTAATGQLYAIRRALATPVPDGVTDDFHLSTGAVDAGRRLWFEPGAVAHGPVAASTEAEFRRKVRLIGRGFASVWSRRRLLDPRRTGFYALQLLTHKVLRRLVGLPLVALAATAPLLWSVHPIYALAAVAQLGFHGLAALGFALRDTRVGGSAPFALPLAFDAANLAGLIAFFRFARGRTERGWSPERGSAALRAPSPEKA
jgi:cellulose synthase/poly-beta-1,6-N-acetylglucosamine synthase-like glycosyltransferase